MAEIDRSQLNFHTGNAKKTVEIEGCRLIKQLIYIDNRGTFKKIVPAENERVLDEFPICQVNVSTNTSAGTIRGLHYQISPFLEAKLISCIKGSVFDVLLDLRPDSNTYGKYTLYNLSPGMGSLLVPPLVAHGFQTLADDTTLLYLHSNKYSPNDSRGVNPIDPSLGIEWPLPITSISESDRKLPPFLAVK